MSVGKGLRILRQERGLSQRKAAKNAGVSYGNLSEIENEKISPYIITVKTIAEANGLDMHRLAHYAFDLPEPEELGELDEDLKVVCAMISKLSEGRRKVIIGKIQGWIEHELEGGGATDKTHDAQAGFG